MPYSELLRSEDGNVIGVLTGDWTRHLADKVVLATGGWSDSLFDFEGQLLVSFRLHARSDGVDSLWAKAGAYSTTHIQLTQAEADMLRARALPVIAVDSVGFMLPVTDDNILKVCDLEPGQSAPCDLLSTGTHGTHMHLRQDQPGQGGGSI